MSIHMTARFRVHPESLDKCQQAIAEFVAYVKHNEPGTHLYASLQEDANETEFLHYFIFKDEAAEEAHRTSQGVRRFTDILYPELEEDVVFTRYRLLATS